MSWCSDSSMLSPASALVALKCVGVELRAASGNRLLAAPPRRLTPELTKAIRQHKPLLLLWAASPAVHQYPLPSLQGLAGDDLAEAEALIKISHRAPRSAGSRLGTSSIRSGASWSNDGWRLWFQVAASRSASISLSAKEWHYHHPATRARGGVPMSTIRVGDPVHFTEPVRAWLENRAVTIGRHTPGIVRGFPANEAASIAGGVLVSEAAARLPDGEHVLVSVAGGKVLIIAPRETIELSGDMVRLHQRASLPPEGFVSQDQASTNRTPQDASLLAAVLLAWWDKRSQEPWSGRASELLMQLSSVATDDQRRARGYPVAPNVLTGELRRLTTSLRSAGLSVTLRRSNRGMIVAVASAPSPNVTGR